MPNDEKDKNDTDLKTDLDIDTEVDVDDLAGEIEVLKKALDLKEQVKSKMEPPGPWPDPPEEEE